MEKFILFLFCFAISLHADTAPLHTDLKVESLKNKVLHALPYFEGWCTEEKALNFVELVLEVKPEVCVEIGVFGGRSLLPVALALKLLGKGIVIGIDPWNREECIKYYDPIKDEADLRWWSNLNFEYVYSDYQAMIKKLLVEKYCFTLRTTSEDAVSEIGVIDILHIDGNHSEIASLQDVALYLPKVRAGGYIWMTDALWGERRRAVEQLQKFCDVVKVIEGGNCILFKKR